MRLYKPLFSDLCMEAGFVTSRKCFDVSALALFGVSCLERLAWDTMTFQQTVNVEFLLMFLYYFILFSRFNNL